MNNTIEIASPREFPLLRTLLLPGVRIFSTLRFAAKLILITMIITVPMVGLLGYSLANEAEQALHARKDSTRQHVEVAYGVLAWAYAQQQSGAFDERQAQEAAMQAVAGMRYEGQEYFWINDLQPRVVMHPIKPELNGENVAHLKDPNGVAIFEEFAAVVREKGKGYVSYQWPKAGSEVPVDKVSYVLGFEPWGWVIGSGIYIDDLQSAHRQNILNRLVFAFIAGLFAAYALLSFYRSVQSGLQKVSQQLNAITHGDLSMNFSHKGRDESAMLGQQLALMQESVSGMVARVRNTSEEILHSSSEINNGALDLSSRTAQAASHLEESAASMEEITSTVKHSDTNTQEASRVAKENAASAANGGNAMQEVATTMDAIHKSSTQINQITGTINDIAFQTNLLALNAAVEAARAGDSGRGFAVVASEVRVLAQRSADAAREINTLIEGSVKNVANGANVVKKACSSIETIIASSHNVDRLLHDVSVSAQEQSIGVSQIGQSLIELDNMTQNNAALVSQTSSATKAMREQAALLVNEVSRYRLSDNVDTGLVAGPSLSSASAIDTSSFDFDTAIDAHRQWKVKLRKAISDKETLDADTICRDDVCPLGQWIHGEECGHWKTQPAFQELISQHAEFHIAAADVARQINAGKYDDAKRMIRSGTKFSQISNEVCSRLTKAKKWMR